LIFCKANGKLATKTSKKSNTWRFNNRNENTIKRNYACSKKSRARII